VKAEEGQRDSNIATAERLFAIVLAAGSGSRFGGIKQLAMYDDMPLVRRAVRLAESACGPRSLLVAGYEWRAVVDACHPLQGFFTNNVAYREGMGCSIACGVRAVMGAADAVLLALADQPLVTADHLQHLLGVWAESPDSIVVTSFAGTEGPPVIFPVRCFAKLRRLEGDQGARAVLRNAGGPVRHVEFQAAAVDVDAPEDLEKLT